MKQEIVLQRIEGVAIFAASILFYINLDFNVVWFFVLLLVPDIFMLGYLKDKKIGARVYNLGHTLTIPIIATIAGFSLDSAILLGGGLIWTAHVGMDRAFGYGLKTEKGFKHTHLGDLK